MPSTRRRSATATSSCDAALEAVCVTGLAVAPSLALATGDARVGPTGPGRPPPRRTGAANGARARRRGADRSGSTRSSVGVSDASVRFPPRRSTRCARWPTRCSAPARASRSSPPPNGYREVWPTGPAWSSAATSPPRPSWRSGPPRSGRRPSVGRRCRGTPVVMVEAGFAGVPTIIGAPDRRAVASQIDPNLVVEEVEEGLRLGRGRAAALRRARAGQPQLAGARGLRCPPRTRRHPPPRRPADGVVGPDRPAVNLTEPVTVVVPVYDGFDETVGCIESVLRAGRAVGPDGAAGDRRPCRRTRAFGPTSTRWRRGTNPVPVRVVHHDTNLGFVKSVQRGLPDQPGRRGGVELGHRRDRRLARTSRRRGDGAGRRDGDAADVLRVDLHVAAVGDRRVRPVRRRTSHRRVRRVRGPLLGRGASRGHHRRRVLHVRDPRRPRPLRHLRRGGVRARLRRGGRLLPARHPPRLPPPRRGLHLRPPLRRRVLRRRAGAADRECVPRHPQAVPDLSRGQQARAGTRAAGRVVRVARAGPVCPRHEPSACPPAAAQPARWALGGTEKHVAALLDALSDEFDFSVLHPVESGFVLRTMWRRTDGTTAEVEFQLPTGHAPTGRRRTTKPPPRRSRWCSTGSTSTPSTSRTSSVYSLAPLDVLAYFDGPVVCSVRRPVPRLPQLLAALPRPTGLRHPRGPLLLRPLPARDEAPRRRRADRVPRHAGVGARQRRHLGVRHPERSRLPAARLRHRPRSNPRSSPTAPSSRPSATNPSTTTSSCTNRSASPSSVVAGPRRASTPSTVSPTSSPTRPSSSTTSASWRNRRRRAADPRHLRQPVPA